MIKPVQTQSRNHTGATGARLSQPQRSGQQRIVAPLHAPQTPQPPSRPPLRILHHRPRLCGWLGLRLALFPAFAATTKLSS
jgi:hypothetical protein